MRATRLLLPASVGIGPHFSAELDNRMIMKKAYRDNFNCVVTGGKD